MACLPDKDGNESMFDDQADSNHQMGNGGSQIGHSWWKRHVFGPSALVCYSKVFNLTKKTRVLT